MTGTIINSVVVFAAGFLGCFIKKAIPERIEQPIMNMVGLSVFLIALLGFFSTALTIENGTIKSNGEIMMLVCLAAGVAIGELIRIDDRLNEWGKKIEEKAGVDGFARGFVTASLLFCIGAMAIFGALKDGISGDSSVLIVKSMIDAITAFILSTSLGIGVAFAGVSVFVYQGAIAMLATYIQPFVTDAMMMNICTVGYAIVVAIGTNMLGLTKIKLANTLPAMLLAVIYTFLFV
ncbi:MAG: DUF554 domain-containing protein [Oscillospiraceae bacterium]|nr:DUF554 domain-containing protein [Oscillospiraceae bacterium]MBR2504178.1 DUF554 domain-containing protein [Oscillospiraceae bacterium]